MPYPGGPLVDKMAALGNPKAFHFPMPKAPGLNFSFSGIKTSFLYLVRDGLKENPDFISTNQNDLCASFQDAVIHILLDKLQHAAELKGIKEIAIAGGVSANSGLRNALTDLSKKKGWTIHIPKMAYCTDNAAMIAITGYYKFLKKEFTSIDVTPLARYPF
jgi:N6-L-threonylcarbamoyladenine synthase